MNDATIELDPSANDNGLALLLQPLIEGNLRDNPWKADDLSAIRGDVAITARDDDSAVAVTLRFLDKGLVVRDGDAPQALVHVTASYEDVLLLTQVPITRGRLPNLLSSTGRALMAKLARREIRVGGMLRHPVILYRLTRLMSVVSQEKS